MMSMLRIAAMALMGLSLLLMAVSAPGATWRELQLLGTILLLTAATRSMGLGSGVQALSLGLGLTTLLVIGAGHAMSAAGIDTTDGVGNWGLVPLVEEAVKLAPVAIVAWLYARRRRFAPNPSDLLMLGCFAGAGFALVENAALVAHNGGAARDMARQFGPHLGPFYLVPGAWGSAGYVGHAAATGFICGGYGLGLALRDRLGPSWWAVPAAAAGWILVEHVFVNLYVGTASSVALMLGNGRLTPWLFVAMAIAIVAVDALRFRSTLARSATLRRRVAMTRAAMLRTAPPVPKSRPAAVLLFLSQLRLVNLTGWYVRDKLPAEAATAVRLEPV